MTPHSASNSNTCLELLNQELDLFDDEYALHSIKGISKESHIGRPFLLQHPTSNKGILLIHGLMAAPEEVREWADFLFNQGFTVYAPRLAGHGTTAENLSTHTMEDWSQSVKRGHNILKQCCQHISIAGFSTGAALALNHVITHPNDFDSVISISAPLKFKKFSAHFAKPVNSWNRLLTALDISSGKKEFVTNHADNPHINYLKCPISSIVQIQLLMKGVQAGLPNIKIPSLMIHGTADPKVDVQSSRDIYKLIGSNNKSFYEIDFDLHGIIRGDISQAVFAHVKDFLDPIKDKCQPV